MFKRIGLYGAAALAGVICAVIFFGIFTITTVTGSGMEPALADGTPVLINKLAYRAGDSEPKVGQVVAFPSDVYGEEGEGKILVRRIAGVPGDVIEIRDNIFYRNDRPYTEYMAEAVHLEDMERTQLGENQLFLLSDNRKSSMDSRNEAIGTVSLKECIGKVCLPIL